MALFAAVLMPSTAAFAQATAEAALTHALSSATGAAVGKTLGAVTNQMATRVSGQLGQQTTAAVPKSKAQPVKSAARNSDSAPSYGTTSEPPAGGSLVVSIQGAAPQPPCDSTPKDSPSKADSASKPPACPAAASDSHPSEITLPAPK